MNYADCLVSLRMHLEVCARSCLITSLSISLFRKDRFNTERQFLSGSSSPMHGDKDKKEVSFAGELLGHGLKHTSRLVWSENLR